MSHDSWIKFYNTIKSRMSLMVLENLIQESWLKYHQEPYVIDNFCHFSGTDYQNLTNKTGTWSLKPADSAETV